MDKDLGWFKFSPLKWMTGRIKKESAKVQIAFCDLMCQYWKKKCDMTLEQAELEIGDSLAILLKRKIVKQDGDKIKIEFLDEQMVSIADTSVKRSNAAKSKWSKEHSKTMQLHASALQNGNGAMQIDADKIRREKTREEEREIMRRELFSDELFTETLQRDYSGKDWHKGFTECWNFHTQKGAVFETWEWRKKLLTWLNTMKGEPTKKNKGKIQ